MQPQPMPLNLSGNFGGLPFGAGLTMNTGGGSDPFAELESELKRNPPPPASAPITNYQDLQLLS